MDSLESPSLTCNDSPPELSDTEQEQTPQANNSSNAKAVEMVPPDGGWGWMVVAGSFLIFSVGGYTLYAFSIFLSPILMSDQVSSIKIAWIFNFNHLILSFYTIFIGPLCEQFGTRKMAIFGGVASFLSLFLSAFAPTVDYLFFTYAVPAGIGLVQLYHIWCINLFYEASRVCNCNDIVGDCLVVSFPSYSKLSA
ncbi:hypothetical protein Avbf_05944 [Armadillidium vulgare]|nr:hypothetical protein Avbf_05944 [Armadillidium vulgare]